MHLINVDNLLDRFFLTDDHPTKSGLQRLRVPSGFTRVQWDIEPFHFVDRLSQTSGGHLP
jgi:hypothetical protein